MFFHQYMVNIPIYLFTQLLTNNRFVSKSQYYQKTCCMYFTVSPSVHVLGQLLGGNIERSRMARSKGRCILNFSSIKLFLQKQKKSSIIVNFHQQCIRNPVDPYLGQHFVEVSFGSLNYPVHMQRSKLQL